MTTTWAQAAEAKAREALPRLQRELDAARSHLDELRERQAAVERAITGLDRDADPDIALAIQMAGELLLPLLAAAEGTVAEATTARRAARADLLPMEDSPWWRSPPGRGSAPLAKPTPAGVRK